MTPDAAISLNLPEDWFLLLLRVLFVFLIYFFLFQVFRVQIRELVMLGSTTRQPQSAPAGARLIVLEGGENPSLVGQSLLLRTTNTVGRSPENGIVLPEPFVSTRHAVVTFAGGNWQLTDFGSRNGTFVNGQPVHGGTTIQPGDVVQFGRVQVQFVV